MTFVLTLALFACILALPCGLLMLAFKRGKRKMGAAIALASLGVMLIAGPIVGERRAADEGFASAEEMHADQRAKDASAKATKAAALAATRRYGEHCLLTNYDARHRQFYDDVRAMMKDPDSFEMIETKTGQLHNGRHEIEMTYRARNGIGLIGIGTARGSFKHDGCEAVVLAIE